MTICEDAISRQAALDCLTATKLKKFDFILQARAEMKKLPPVTPQEPRKGYWEHGKELCKEYRGRILVDVIYADWHCSNCNYVIKGTVKPKWNYCPNCGQPKMQEVEE